MRLAVLTVLLLLAASFVTMDAKPGKKDDEVGKKTGDDKDKGKEDKGKDDDKDKGKGKDDDDDDDDDDKDKGKGKGKDDDDDDKDKGKGKDKDKDDDDKGKGKGKGKDDDDDKKPPKKLKAPKWKRKLDVKVEKRKVKIDAKSDFEEKTRDGKEKRKDDIKFEIEGEKEGLELELDYKYSEEANRTHSKFSIKYKFVVESILEFVPTDLAQGFQEGKDTVVQELKLEEWSDMVRGTATVSESQVDTFTIKGGKKGGALLFTSKGHISTNTLNDLDYSSNYVKFGYDIDNFPYQGNNTALAIQTKIKGKFKARTKTKGKKRSGKGQELVKFQNQGIELPEGSPFGRFSWVTTAEAGGKTVDIISSVKDDEKDGNTRYFFTFNTRAQPASISWDPDVGVGYPEDEDADGQPASGSSKDEDGLASYSSTISMVSSATLISLLPQFF